MATDRLKSSFAHQLLAALRRRSAPLPVLLEEHGVIVAQNFDYTGPFSVSITFAHPQGDIIVGSNWPSRAELMGLTRAQLLRSSYSELAEFISADKGCEWRELEECPWLDPSDAAVRDCFDAEGHFISESPGLRSRLLQWLKEEDEEAAWLDGLFPDLNEGLVGYAIRDVLPEAEVKRLRLVTGDFRGGPGGYAERVAYPGEPAVLEAVLRTYRLPFTLAGCEEGLP